MYKHITFCLSVAFLLSVSTTTYPQETASSDVPTIQVISRTATLLLTLPNKTVTKVQTNEPLPEIPWGTKISAVFGQATIIAGKHKINLLDGCVVKPYFDKNTSKITIIVPPESITPITVTVGKNVVILKKNEVISLIPGQMPTQTTILVVKGEIDISGPSGQFSLGEGGKTTVTNVEEKQVQEQKKPEQPKKGIVNKKEESKKKEEQKVKSKEKQEKKEQEQEEVKVKQQEDSFPQDPLIIREEASPSSP